MSESKLAVNAAGWIEKAGFPITLLLFATIACFGDPSALLALSNCYLAISIAYDRRATQPAEPRVR